MLQKFVRIFGGNPHKREIEKCTEAVEQINALEADFERLSDAELRAKTDEFRARLAGDETLDDLLPEAFAAVREVSKRTIGLRPYDVQMIGGITLFSGTIAEMRTGEGKTLVATLPLYLNALAGKGAHLVTVNDYLARRDARWMAPIYNGLGLSVGVLQMAARTENGKNAFMVDSSIISPHEDAHQLRVVLRAEAYQADITYGTNSEFGFDYLRDNLTMSLEERSQRGHFFAIVDEVDNILIDEARTPLIISGPASEDTEWYAKMAQIVRQLQPEDYEVNEKDRAVNLTEVGDAHVEELLNMPLRDPERPEDITPEQARLMGYLEQAMRAQYLYRRNKDYLVQAGKVVIVDEFTGRLMPGRRWSEGLHQAVEAKEGVKVEPENVTYATITLQNYFRMYGKLAGMTGTAETEAEEFHKIYKLEVLPIPTNLEYSAASSGSPLEMLKTRDEQGYEYQYYASRMDPSQQPLFFRRKDYPDVVFRTEEAKLRAITQEIIRLYVIGRPQLVGTTSVEHSDRLSLRLGAESGRRLLQTLLIRYTYLEKNNIQMIERAIPELEPLNKVLPDLDLTEMRQLARKLELTLNLEDDTNLDRLITVLELPTSDRARLLSVIQGGVPHQVLNARKHDAEAQIIAGAGAYGAVTIATNMAGRGVDIKLGGVLPDDVLQDTLRVLNSAGVTDPYDLTNEQRRAELLKLTPEQYGIYEEAVKAFLRYLDEMERVRELGGLHVVGSERHEARRIDNQLRGRAARQGDPGSSRFYLSLEDELMRLFGGQQADGLFERLKIDANLPIEHKMLGRLVEQSQERVEGTNFDIRKHLLEYDDVLNSQRNRIYGQRNRVFEKEDLSQDVLDMLSTQLQERVLLALKEEDGAWKLLAYLEEIQPTIDFEDVIYPSYAIQLLINEVRRRMPANGDSAARLRASLLELGERTLQAEREHTLTSVQNLLVHSEEDLEAQLQERMDALDTYFDSFTDTDEETGLTRRPQDVLNEISELVRLPLRLNPDQLRRMVSPDRDVQDAIRDQVRISIMTLISGRVIGAVERRLEESSGLKATNNPGQPWTEFANDILSVVETSFDRRAERLVGREGQVTRDLDDSLEGEGSAGEDDRNLIRLLQVMVQGSRRTFDAKTHRQGVTRYNRLNYVYLAAGLLADQTPKEVTADVLEHLQGAQLSLVKAWGRMEWLRFAQSGAILGAFEPALQENIRARLGDEQFNVLLEVAPLEFDVDARDAVSAALGDRLQNSVYRHLLLSVISELWVDYLTQVEALRVSIGMEAYAQRDPLVMYKSKATELFARLLADIRLGVISRMFTYQPRRSDAAAVDQNRPAQPVETGAELPVDSAIADAPVTAHKKRRHH